MVRANNELAANILLGVMIAITVGLLGWPFLLYLKLPQPLKLPTNEAELGNYRKRLLKRLRSNKILNNSCGGVRYYFKPRFFGENSTQKYYYDSVFSWKRLRKMN